MAAPTDFRPWAFDVSSLMVLISEQEEHNYRLSRRSLSQCLAALPVVGLQNYVRSYDLLLETTGYTYFSPYGAKSAPLRNAQLSNAITLRRLLEDQRYTVYSIPADSGPHISASRMGNKWHIILVMWTGATWLLFAGLLVGTILIPEMTWVSVATCTAYTGWSIFLRLVEYFNILPAPISEGQVIHPELPDAVFVMGRSNSAFVLEGNRKDVKYWTGRGLIYKDRPLGLPSWLWQGFTRLGSLLVLLFIFSAIPNGSTVDQVVFVLLNSLAQVNVLLGQRLDSRYSLSKLRKLESTREQTRTHIYAKLIRRFSDAEHDAGWIEASDMLPRTETWDKWRNQILQGNEKDPKILYAEIADYMSDPSTLRVVSGATIHKPG